MASTNASVTHPTVAMTSGTKPHFVALNADWKVQCANWENFLSNKDTRACELASVHTALFKIAKHTATLSQSTDIEEITSALIEGRNIIAKHLAITMQEAEHAQRMIKYLKTNVTVPKVRKVEDKILLQLVECLENTDPDVKVRDLLATITANLITMELPAKKVGTIRCILPPQEPRLWSPELGVTKESSKKDTQLVEAPKTQGDAALSDTTNIQPIQNEKTRVLNGPSGNNNGKIHMRTVTHPSSAAQKTATSANKAKHVPTSQRAAKATRASSSRKAETLEKDITPKVAVSCETKVNRDEITQDLKSRNSETTLSSSNDTTSRTPVEKSTNKPDSPVSDPSRPIESPASSTDSSPSAGSLQRRKPAKDSRKGLRKVGEPGVARKLTSQEQRERRKKREEEERMKKAQESDANTTSMCKGLNKHNASTAKDVIVGCNDESTMDVPAAIESLDTSDIIWTEGHRRHTGGEINPAKDHTRSDIAPPNGSKRKREDNDEGRCASKKASR
ncbi:hypothetical protein T440DRAFT_438147 [Plenodomus tracheiphilus IPT5]|uniref:Uncharacterized protein n=1 Tax=Plenodomus tracheiphilus IPT5 TaxID=1408161 RepID=A0A6A7BP24_9PLEO|nr:hypothetical protein T440DRAFT_438147 [Plenodomus tracheiphilus IPT5]